MDKGVATVAEHAEYDNLITELEAERKRNAENLRYREQKKKARTGEGTPSTKTRSERTNQSNAGQSFQESTTPFCTE